MKAMGSITSSYTFNVSTQHTTNYVYVFTCTYTNALDDEGGIWVIEAGKAEVESGREARLSQAHVNFSALAQRLYYIVKMDVEHRVYAGTTADTKGNVIYVFQRTIKDRRKLTFFLFLRNDKTSC